MRSDALAPNVRLASGKCGWPVFAALQVRVGSDAARTLGFTTPPDPVPFGDARTFSSSKGRFATGIANEDVPDFVPEVRSCGDEPALERGRRWFGA